MSRDAQEWKLFEAELPRRVKPLLHLYRVLPIGIPLRRGGRVEANLVRLKEEHRLPGAEEPIARKPARAEGSVLGEAGPGFPRDRYERSRAEPASAAAASPLPATPSARASLNDPLLRPRPGWAARQPLTSPADRWRLRAWRAGARVDPGGQAPGVLL